MDRTCDLQVRSIFWSGWSSGWLGVAPRVSVLRPLVGGMGRIVGEAW